MAQGRGHRQFFITNLWGFGGYIQKRKPSQQVGKANKTPYTNPISLINYRLIYCYCMTKILVVFELPAVIFKK